MFFTVSNIYEKTQLKAGFEEDLKFFNKGLDESQREAIKFTFEQKDLAIIHGLFSQFI